MSCTPNTQNSSAKILNLRSASERELFPINFSDNDINSDSILPYFLENLSIDVVFDREMSHSNNFVLALPEYGPFVKEISLSVDSNGTSDCHLDLDSIPPDSPLTHLSIANTWILKQHKFSFLNVRSIILVISLIDVSLLDFSLCTNLCVFSITSSTLPRRSDTVTLLLPPSLKILSLQQLRLDIPNVGQFSRIEHLFFQAIHCHHHLFQAIPSFQNIQTFQSLMKGKSSLPSLFNYPTAPSSCMSQTLRELTLYSIPSNPSSRYFFPTFDMPLLEKFHFLCDNDFNYQYHFDFPVSLKNSKKLTSLQFSYIKFNSIPSELEEFQSLCLLRLCSCSFVTFLADLSKLENLIVFQLSPIVVGLSTLPFRTSFGEKYVLGPDEVMFYNRTLNKPRSPSQIPNTLKSDELSKLFPNINASITPVHSSSLGTSSSTSTSSVNSPKPLTGHNGHTSLINHSHVNHESPSPKSIGHMLGPPPLDMASPSSIDQVTHTTNAQFHDSFFHPDLPLESLINQTLSSKKGSQFPLSYDDPDLDIDPDFSDFPPEYLGISPSDVADALLMDDVSATNTLTSASSPGFPTSSASFSPTFHDNIGKLESPSLSISRGSPMEPLPMAQNHVLSESGVRNGDDTQLTLQESNILRSMLHGTDSIFLNSANESVREVTASHSRSYKHYPSEWNPTYDPKSTKIDLTRIHIGIPPQQDFPIPKTLKKLWFFNRQRMINHIPPSVTEYVGCLCGLGCDLRIIQTCPNLEKLTLRIPPDFRKFVAIPANFHNLFSHLSTFSVFGIHTVPGPPRVRFPVNFSFPMCIKSIIMLSCNLPELPNSIGLCKELEHLDFSHNSLSYVPDFLFALPKLDHIKLIDNKISEIDIPMNFKQIIKPRLKSGQKCTILLDSNPIRDIPFFLAENAMLSTVILNKNADKPYLISLFSTGYEDVLSEVQQLIFSREHI